MKHILLLIYPLFLSVLVFSQKSAVLKGYAFQRVTIPAIRTTAIAEGTGAETQKPNKQRVTSFVFIEHKPATIIKPSVLWLYGSPYTVTYEPVKEQTVIISRNSVTGRLVSDTLVKKTENHILSISPSSKLNLSKPASVAKKITDKNAVLEYYVKGKKYFYIIPSIKNLEPLTLQ